MMVDPVVDPNGNSYERAAIEAWLAQSATSPTTREPLLAAQLAPNRALKDAIEGFQNIQAREAGGPAVLLPQTIDDGQQAAAAIPGVISAAKDVGIKLSAARDGDTVLVRATAVPPEGTNRTPTEVCMVVDVSGSMGAEATMLNADGAREAHGLSLLDITKHAVATVIETLGPADRFTLVAYSSAVKTPCAAVAMDGAGKQLARRQLEALRPGGQTNLWAGLEARLYP
jgi:hypothetical protein